MPIIMYTTVEFTLDAGGFNLQGGVNFREPDVRIPLVQSVKIGRAANPAELEFCDGVHIGEVDFEYGKGFQGRPSYDGKKLIFPWGFRRISRDQGVLIFNYPENISYTHNSENSNTVLWVPEKGIVGVASKPGDTIENLLDWRGETQAESYLLFGGFDGSTLEEKFAGFAYYARIGFNDTEVNPFITRRVFEINSRK